MNNEMKREGKDGGINKDERIDINKMLIDYKIKEEKEEGIDDKDGSMKKGKKEELIIVEREIFNVQYDLFKNKKVIRKYFEGKLVYRLN